MRFLQVVRKHAELISICLILGIAGLVSGNGGEWKKGEIQQAFERDVNPMLMTVEEYALNNISMTRISFKNKGVWVNLCIETGLFQEYGGKNSFGKADSDTLPSWKILHAKAKLASTFRGIFPASDLKREELMNYIALFLERWLGWPSYGILRPMPDPRNEWVWIRFTSNKGMRICNVQARCPAGDFDNFDYFLVGSEGAKESVEVAEWYINEINNSQSPKRQAELTHKLFQGSKFYPEIKGGFVVAPHGITIWKWGK